MSNIFPYKFEVGEVAIYYDPPSQFHLCEVTVIGALDVRNVYHRDLKKHCNQLCYIIDAPVKVGARIAGRYVIAAAALPEQLLKKKPPGEREGVRQVKETTV